MKRDRRTSRSFAWALAVTVLSAIGLSAQSSPESSARRTADTFDVVSIRPHEGPVRNASAMRPGGRFQSESTLRQLIRYAYGLEPSQQLAGTSDVLDRQFVIEARVAPERVSATGSHLPMVRALLAERFKLRVRFEDEIQTVATIVRRESDKPGPRLRALTHDCRLPSPPEDKRPPCTLAIIDGHLKAVVPNMADFARRLSYSGRAFVDGTGLTGPYELEMYFDSATLDERVAGATPSQFPSFAEALQKDLGLRLETQRRPVPALIVEHVEPPTKN